MSFLSRSTMLNDWVGCMGGHPQALTPNLDRLAATGVLFENAHCPAPACNPSRTIFTGISPHVSGLYRNEQKMREVMPGVELLPKTFSKAGYWSGGSGKMLHYFMRRSFLGRVFPPKETETLFPRHWGRFEASRKPSKRRALAILRDGLGAIDATDEEYGGTTRWRVGEGSFEREGGKALLFSLRNLSSARAMVRSQTIFRCLPSSSNSASSRLSFKRSRRPSLPPGLLIGP